MAERGQKVNCFTDIKSGHNIIYYSRHILLKAVRYGRERTKGKTASLI